MYKKEIFRDLDKKYNSHLYTGLLGILMNYCHRKLENFDFGVSGGLGKKIRIK